MDNLFETLAESLRPEPSQLEKVKREIAPALSLEDLYSLRFFITQRIADLEK